MKCYIVFEAVRIKNQTVAHFQELTNSQQSVIAFESKERAKNYAQSLSQDVQLGNKVYVLCSQINQTRVKNEFEFIVPMGAYRVYPAKRRIAVQNELKVKDVEILSDAENSDDIEIDSENETECENESDNSLNNDSQEESASEEEQVENKNHRKIKNKDQESEQKKIAEPLWIKIALGAAASAVVGLGLFLFNAIPSSTVATFAAGHGMHLIYVNLILFGAAGVVGAALLAAAYFAFQMVDKQLLSEKILNKEEYRQALKDESQAVAKLKKKLVSQNKAALCTKLDELVNSSKPRKFNKEGEPIQAENSSEVDKLVVLQWERKKLDELNNMLEKKDKRKFEKKILKKAKIKFGA